LTRTRSRDSGVLPLRRHVVAARQRQPLALRRQPQTYFLDFNLDTLSFEGRLHRAKIKTAAGVFDMQPQGFYQDAVAQSFTRPPKQHGLAIIDSLKSLDGITYSILNNFAIGQNALLVLNPALSTFEVLGSFNQSSEMTFTGSVVNRLPDGTWLAICRQDGGERNYRFASGKDGKGWSRHEYRAFVLNGANSKPVFEIFYGIYYLGWQEITLINNFSRSV
jgi:hypothetical protein